MQSIFLGYGKSEDPNSWVLFIGDDINTDASPTNPGRFYGGANYMALEVDNQGNYLVGSTRYQSSSVNGLLYLSKISNQGLLLWEFELTEQYGTGPLYDCRTYMEDIVVDDENAIYVTGSIVTTGAQNGFLMKLSDTGLVQWQQHWAYPNVSYTNVGYKVRFNDNNDPVVFGTYNYTRGYEVGGHLQHGICYAFDKVNGTRLTDTMFIGSSGGLGSCYFYDADRIGDYFYIRMNGYYTHSPYVGGRSQSAIIKTNMSCTTLEAIQNTHIGSNSNVYIYEGLETNGTNVAATTQLNDGAGGGPKQWHIFDTDLNQLYGWRYSNSAAGVIQGLNHNWVYEGNFIYAAVTTNDELVHFFKFNMTTGAIIWQNKMQGDTNNKIASNTYNESYLRKDADGYLVYLNSTNKTELYGDAHVLISFRVPEDGTALGDYGNYEYSASTDVSLTTTDPPTGTNPAVYPSATGPTDYGDPAVVDQDPNIPIYKVSKI